MPLTIIAACFAGLMITAVHAAPLRIAVVGDSIAYEIGRGMEALFRNKRNVRITRYTRVSSGLVRSDYFNWHAALRRFLARHRPNVIVVNIGGNDRQNMVVNGRRLTRFSPSWRAHYQRRARAFMDILSREGARVYWVGLPIVRSARMSRDYRALNRIFRREASRHGFTYVSIWQTFAGSHGGFSSFGRGLDGAKRQLRDPDGIHFSTAGRLRLAAHVARAMRLR